jgi:hypothetical protein
VLFIALGLTRIQTHTTYTCGEDGQIRAWKGQAEETMDVDDSAEPAKKKDRKEKRKEKKDKKDKERFKPY